MTRLMELRNTTAAMVTHSAADAQSGRLRTVDDLLGVPRSDLQSSNGWLSRAAANTTIEVSPASLQVVADIASRVSASGGAALIIDYGNDFAADASLRGIRNAAFTQFLDSPGAADVTADVDFRALRLAARAATRDAVVTAGPITQSELLQRLGLRERIEQILSGLPDTPEGDAQRQRVVEAANRIASLDEMGAVYKALAIVPRPLAQAAGIVGFPERR